MSRAFRYVIIALLIFAQSIFLGTILLEKYQDHIWLAVFMILAVAILLWLAYLKVNLHHHEHQIDDSLVALWVPVGAVFCYFLSNKQSLGSVIGAGITGTIGSFLPNIQKKSTYLSKIPIPIYCGAFVGMSSEAIAPSFGFVIAAGILAGVLLLYSKSLFLGVGGKLGTLAFASVILTTFIFYLLKKGC